MHKLTRQAHKLLEKLRPNKSMSAASECYSMAGLAIFFIVITKTQAYQYFLIHGLSLWGINDLNVADGVLVIVKIGALSLALLYGSRGVDFTGFSLLFSDFFGVKKRS